MNNNIQKLLNISSDLYYFFKKYNGAEVGSLAGFLPYEEVAGSTDGLFEERKPKAFKQRFQISSSSCVAQTQAKMLEVESEGKEIFTALPCYNERSNKPNLGMLPIDALNFPNKRGTASESEIPSQYMNEWQMNNTKYDDKNFVKMPSTPMFIPVNFNTVAQAIKDNGSAMLFFKASYSEWCRDIPSGLSNSEDFRHSVAGVDTITYKGVKYIIIEDSAGTWVKTSEIPLAPGQRAITEEFFNKHCYFAGTWSYFEYTESKILKKDKFKFTKVMNYGETSEDVRQVQVLLQKLGLFPSNRLTTGKYLDITRKAVKAFQIKYSVDNMAILNNINGKRAGEKTIAKLNEVQSK